MVCFCYQRKFTICHERGCNPGGTSWSNLSRILGRPLDVKLLEIVVHYFYFAKDLPTHFNKCSHYNVMLFPDTCLVFSVIPRNKLVILHGPKRASSPKFSFESLKFCTTLLVMQYDFVYHFYIKYLFNIKVVKCHNMS